MSDERLEVNQPSVDEVDGLSVDTRTVAKLREKKHYQQQKLSKNRSFNSPERTFHGQFLVEHSRDGDIEAI